MSFYSQDSASKDHVARHVSFSITDPDHLIEFVGIVGFHYARLLRLFAVKPPWSSPSQMILKKSVFHPCFSALARKFFRQRHELFQAQFLRAFLRRDFQFGKRGFQFFLRPVLFQQFQHHFPPLRERALHDFHKTRAQIFRQAAAAARRSKTTHAESTSGAGKKQSAGILNQSRGRNPVGRAASGCRNRRRPPAP